MWSAGVRAHDLLLDVEPQHAIARADQLHHERQPDVAEPHHAEDRRASLAFAMRAVRSCSQCHGAPPAASEARTPLQHPHERARRSWRSRAALPAPRTRTKCEARR